VNCEECGIRSHNLRFEEQRYSQLYSRLKAYEVLRIWILSAIAFVIEKMLKEAENRAESPS